MNRFVSRSQEFRPADEGPTPQEADDLLELLDVAGKPFSFQQLAVGEWLRTHRDQASPMLMTSLNDEGLLPSKTYCTPIRVLAAYVATAGDELLEAGALRTEDQEALAEAWLQLRAEREVLATGERSPARRPLAAIAPRERSHIELAPSVLDTLGRHDTTQRPGKPSEIRGQRLDELLELLEGAANGDREAAGAVRDIFVGVSANLRAR